MTIKKSRKLDWNKLFELTRAIPKGLDRKIKHLIVDKKVREQIKNKSNNRCGVCNVKGEYGVIEGGKIDLQLHHIIPNKNSIEDNLIYLCPHCHKLVHLILFLENKWRYIPY